MGAEELRQMHADQALTQRSQPIRTPAGHGDGLQGSENHDGAWKGHILGYFLLAVIAAAVIGTGLMFAYQVPQLSWLIFGLYMLAGLVAILMLSGLLFPLAAVTGAAALLFFMPYLEDEDLKE